MAAKRERLDIRHCIQEGSLMHLLTIASRAELGSTIAERRHAIVQQLGSARGFLVKVQGLKELTTEQNRFAQSTFILGLMSQVEAYLADMAVEILVAFPGKIPQKDVNLASLAKWASITNALRETAERRVYELAQ